MATMMVGRKVFLDVKKPPRTRGKRHKAQIELHTDTGSGSQCFVNIYEGEILGIAGGRQWSNRTR